MNCSASEGVDPVVSGPSIQVQAAVQEASPNVHTKKSRGNRDRPPNSGPWHRGPLLLRADVGLGDIRLFHSAASLLSREGAGERGMLGQRV
ncbi:unnamed protein product [Arctogadus glacialis]